MTPRRQIEMWRDQLAGLTALLKATPDDPLATPPIQRRIKELEQLLENSEKHPTLAPQAELFFSGGTAEGAEGLEVVFTAHILDSYQNMVTNHYSAKHYGALRRSGRRRGEEETKLYLTALPRGSFGLQLSQTHVEDFYAAGNVALAMEEISELVEATAASDQAFETTLTRFNARVFRPLKRFIETLHAGKGTCTMITGVRETRLTKKQIADAYIRISSAEEKEEPVDLRGIFSGVLQLSWEFEFQPEDAEVIRGALAEGVGEEAAIEMNQKFTMQHVLAKMKMIVVTMRTGAKKTNYELVSLHPLSPPPRPARSRTK